MHDDATKRIVVTVALLTALAGCAGDRRSPDQASPDPEPAAPVTDSMPAVSSAGAGARALHDAARQGNLEAVNALLADGVPVDAEDRYGKTALLFAAEYGRAPLVEALIAAGANVRQRERFFNLDAFDLATWKEHGDVVPPLLRAGLDRREDALELAIAAGDFDLVREVLAAGPLNASFLDELQRRDDSADELRALLEDATSRPDPEPPNYTADGLLAFAGRFEVWDAGGGENATAEVEARESGLSLTLGGGEPVTLVATGDRVFGSADGDVEATFWGRLGTVESLTIRVGAARPLRMRHAVAEAVVGAAGLTSTSTATVATDDWPQFRGRRAAGVGTGNVPTRWNPDSGDGVRWQAEIPGLGNSSPIVYGDVVLITTAVAEGIEQDVRTGLTGAGDPVEEKVRHEWRVIALDRRTGRTLWSTVVGDGVPLTRRHFKASQANATPVTDGRRVVAVFPTAGMACLDLASGRVLWRHDLGGLNVSSPNDPGTEWGFASSPVIWEDRVILQVDTYHEPYIAAWRLEDGERLWKTPRSEPPSWATPTVVEVDGGAQIVANAATIRSYDPRDGSEIWSLAPNAELVIATPVLGDGVVYVSSGYAPVKPVYAVRPGFRGELVVQPGRAHEHLAWSHDRGGAYMPTPLVHGGLLYLVHHNGRMVAYDAATGATIYKTRFSAGGTFTASPVADARTLFLGTEEGQVYAIESGPVFREIAVNEMNEPVMATPAISGGTLFVRTTRRLVAVGRPDPAGG